MQHRRAVVASLVLVLLAGSSSPADAFIFGKLFPFFQPKPLFGIQTYVTPTQVGSIYINKFPFTTPPAGQRTYPDLRGFYKHGCSSNCTSIALLFRQSSKCLICVTRFSLCIAIMRLTETTMLYCSCSIGSRYCLSAWTLEAV